MNKIKSDQLLEACQKGDRNAQFELYQKYYGYAFTIAKRYANDEDDAKEIVQDAFLKVFTNLKSYNFEYHFEPWFKKITIRTCIDRHRSNSRIIQTVEIENAVEESAVAENLINADAEYLMILIQRLSPAYRTAFSMYAIDGYEYQEIADMLEVNIGSVKSNISKARFYLKTWVLESKKSLI
jgi:RNA polymerase sigma factor (sigma-70 family)